MLTYNQWYDRIADCRLKNYDECFIQSLKAVTKNCGDNLNQAMSFPHYFQLVMLLLKSTAYLSQFELTTLSDSSSLNPLAHSLCSDLHFWLIVEFLNKKKLLNEPNLHKLLLGVECSKELFISFASLESNAKKLLTPSNVEKILTKPSRAVHIAAIMVQLNRANGISNLFRMGSQEQFNVIVDSLHCDDDLEYLGLLLTTINNATTYLDTFNKISPELFTLALRFAPYALQITIIFNLIDPELVNISTMQILLRVKDSLDDIATSLQILKKRNVQVSDRTYFLKKLLQHGKDYSSIKDFFKKVNLNIILSKFPLLIDLLFENHRDLSGLKRLFALFNQLQTDKLKINVAEFLFKYKRVLLDTNLLSQLEELKKQGALTSVRLNELLKICARFDSGEETHCLNLLLSQLGSFKKAPIEPDTIPLSKRTPDPYMHLYNADLARYLSELDEKPLLNPNAIIESDIPNLSCPISGATMVTPVSLAKHLFDLSSLTELGTNRKGYRRHPITRDPFLLNEIIPAREEAKLIEENLKARKAARMNEIKLSTSSDSFFVGSGPTLIDVPPVESSLKPISVTASSTSSQ